MVRKAHTNDIPAIVKLITENQDKLLLRHEKDVDDLLETFWVIEDNNEIIACCSLEVYNPKIAELRSLAVHQENRGKGLGVMLVKKMLKEAQSRNIKEVLVVTSDREFFEKLNFSSVLNEKFALFWKGE